MDLILRDAGLQKQEVIKKPRYSCSCGLYGLSTNDFELTLVDDLMISIGAFVTYGNTEMGGCIQERITDTNEKSVKYIGKTFRGQLENSIINPFSVLTFNGTPSKMLKNIVDLTVLDYDVEINGNEEEKSVVIPQGTNGLKAIDLVLSACNETMSIRIAGGKPTISHQKINIKSYDSSQVSLIADENQMLPTAIHAYNDNYSVSVYLQKDGTVSTNRYYSGFNAYEITQKISSENESQLQQLASDKLLALRATQNTSEVDVEIDDANIGDKIAVSIRKHGIKATQTISEKILNIENKNIKTMFNVGG